MRRKNEGSGFGAGVVLLGFAVFATVVLTGINAGCGGNAEQEQVRVPVVSASPDSGTVKGNPVPASLEEAGELGENIYDAAKTGDWKTVDGKLSGLNAAAGKMADASVSSQRFEEELKRLASAVSSKDKKETLVESNLITLEIAALTSGYETKVPVGVVKLDFYGRELEIWSAERDTGKLADTARLIRSTWNSVKPRVETAGGRTQSDAFESLVLKVEKAKTPAEYAKTATPILDEVDNLENVFK